MDSPIFHEGVTANRVSPRRGFYAGVGVLLILIAFIGFWPQYYGKLSTGTTLEPVASHWLIHIHSSLFLGWLAIFVSQAALIDRGCRDLHRKIGPWLAFYGYAAAAMGVVAAIGLAARRVTLGGEFDAAAAFVIAPLLDMIMFCGFLTAAIYYRRQAEIHKRLMVFATYSFAFIGLVRFLARRPGILEDPVLGTVAMAAPIIVIAATDTARLRRFHAVWLWGLIAFVARLMIEYAGTTEGWLRIGRPLIRPFV